MLYLDINFIIDELESIGIRASYESVLMNILY